MTTKLHKLYIGLNDKDTKQQIFPTQLVIETLTSTMARNNFDCTISKGTGVYSHNNGDKVTEETIIIEILDFGNFNQVLFKSVCNVIKVLFNQESLGYQVIKLDTCELI